MQRGPQINISLEDDVAMGSYANLGLVNFSAAEFVLDFARVMPGTPRARILDRVIMTPAHAKALQRNLEDALKRYEAAHGEIRVGGQPAEEKYFGFRTPMDEGEASAEEKR